MSLPDIIFTLFGFHMLLKVQWMLSRHRHLLLLLIFPSYWLCFIILRWIMMIILYTLCRLDWKESSTLIYSLFAFAWKRCTGSRLYLWYFCIFIKLYTCTYMHIYSVYYTRVQICVIVFDCNIVISTGWLCYLAQM